MAGGGNRTGVHPGIDGGATTIVGPGPINVVLLVVVAVVVAILMM